MSTQKDTKAPNAKGKKSGNEIAARKAPLREPLALAPYSKSKLSGKPICRKTIKPIKQQLKANGKTIEESLLDLPRFTLYFILHGKVIQEYLDLFAINSGCAPLTVDDVRKVIADNRLGEQIDIDKYDIANKGCSIDDPFVIEYDSGYVPIEHCMMEYILGPFCHERYERQKLFEQEGRFYDILNFKPLSGKGVSKEYNEAYRNHKGKNYPFKGEILDWARNNLGFKFDVKREFKPMAIETYKPDAEYTLKEEQSLSDIDIEWSHDKINHLFAGCGLGKTYMGKRYGEAVSNESDIEWLLNNRFFKKGVCFVTPMKSINRDSFKGVDGWVIIDTDSKEENRKTVWHWVSMRRERVSTRRRNRCGDLSPHTALRLVWGY